MREYRSLVFKDRVTPLALPRRDMQSESDFLLGGVEGRVAGVVEAPGRD